MLRVGQLLSALLENVRFPMLLMIAAGLFVINLVIPDPIPFADEILMGLATMILARLRRRPSPPDKEQAP